MTESSSKSLERSLDQDHTEVSFLREQLKLLESEMESLWRRIQILETRAGTASQNLAKNDAAALSDSINKKHENPNLPQASPPNSAIGASAAPSIPSSSHPERYHRSSGLKPTTGNHRKRARRSRRRSLASKIKRRLLFFYLLLLGIGLFVALVILIFNLFGTEPVLGGSSPTTVSGERSDSAKVNSEIDDKPDLEELRRAIESVDE